MIDYLTPLLEGTLAADWREQPALPPEEAPAQSLGLSGPAAVRPRGEDLSFTAEYPQDGELFGPERADRAFSEPEAPGGRTTGRRRWKPSCGSPAACPGWPGPAGRR